MLSIVHINAQTVDGGEDQTSCDGTAVLSAVTEGGTWSTGGAAIIADPTNTTTTVSNLVQGLNTFTYSVDGVGEDIVLVTNNTVSASAGSDKSVCSTSAILSGSAIPVDGSGTWTLLSGSGEFATPNEAYTTLNGLSSGENVFRWTVSKFDCTDSDDILITNNLYNADAGADLASCTDEIHLAAVNPPQNSGATGQWETIYGQGQIQNINSNSTLVTNLSLGTNQFRWDVTKETCTTSDVVNVTNNKVVVSAGSNKAICSTSSHLYATLLESNQTGLWTCNFPDVIIESPTEPFTNISNLQRGENVFTWTVTKFGCVGTSDVTVTNKLFDAYAGPQQVVTVPEANMNAELPAGGTGSWEILTGNGAISEPTNPQTQITGLGFGSNTFRWTVDFNGCSTFSDVAILYNVAKANAGIDQQSCNNYAILEAEIPENGTGAWSVIQGTGIFENAGDPYTQVNSVSMGENIYRWTVTAYSLEAYDDVSIFNNTFIANAGLDQEGCADEARLNAEIQPEASGSWSIFLGGGSFDNLNSHSAFVSNVRVGDNKYVWHVTKNGCTATDTVLYHRFEPTTIATAGEDRFVCNNFTFQLDGSFPTNGSGQWTCNNNDVVIEAPTSPYSNVTNMPNGSVTFTWTITNENCNSVDQVVLTSYIDAAIEDQPSSVSVQLGSNALLTISVSGDVETYEWYRNGILLNNADSISGANTNELTIIETEPDDENNYKCIVKGYCNTVESEEILLFIEATSITNLLKDNIKLYPNPNTGILFIETDDISVFKSITLYSLEGKQVFYRSLVEKKEQLDLKSLKSGTYLVVIKTKDKTYSTKINIIK